MTTGATRGPAAESSGRVAADTWPDVGADLRGSDRGADLAGAARRDLTEQTASTITADVAHYLVGLVEADQDDRALGVDRPVLIGILSRYAETLTGRYDADLFGEECPVCSDVGTVQCGGRDAFDQSSDPCPHCLYGVEVWRA